MWLALAVAMEPACAKADGDLTLRQWSRLPAAERQATIVAVVEGLLLATASPSGTTTPIDRQCVGTVPLLEVERRLMDASHRRDQALVDAFLEAARCSAS